MKQLYLICWQLYWLFQLRVLVPRARRRNAERRRAWSVQLAVWAHRHGHRRLERAISRFWRIRNFWRFNVGVHIDKLLFKIVYPLRPRCPQCGSRLLAYGSCWTCLWDDALRKRQLSSLTAGRSRTEPSRDL